MSRPKNLKIKQRDGSSWLVPVEVIARNRADTYKNEYGNDIELSLKEDTWPLFDEDDFEIMDWAANNMNWADVKDSAIRNSNTEPLTEADFQEAWVNGKKSLKR